MAVPKWSPTGKGGVAIAVCELYAALPIKEHSCDESALLAVEVGRAGAEILTVVCGYRHPGPLGGLTDTLLEWLQQLHGRKWILAVDWNSPVDGGRFADVCGVVHATLLCAPRYVRGSALIDAVVASRWISDL